MGAFFAELSQEPSIDLTVLYGSDQGVKSSGPAMEDFGQVITWDTDPLSGYEHVFLGSTPSATPSRALTMRARGLQGYVRPSRTDVLVNCGWQYPMNLSAWFWARRSGIPCLFYTDTNIRDVGRTRSRFSPWSDHSCIAERRVRRAVHAGPSTVTSMWRME